MNPELQELEHAFRKSWRDFAPDRYAEYLEQTTEANRLELLARILSVELEYAFQPPPAKSTDQPDLEATVAWGLKGNISVDVASGLKDDDDVADDLRVKPCVPLFLLRFPNLAERTDLVIRLIVLEYALRLRYDARPPNPESYLPLCQQGTDQLIRLLELTESKLPVSRATCDVSQPISHTDSTVKEAAVSASLSLDPLPLNLGCFLLLRLLGRGGMGYVHAAIDLRSTAQVAVKVMRRADAWSIYRFIEEFRWLSQLSHPHLVKLYDAFCEGDVRYFSMELVEGKSVREWFRKLPSQAPARWQELRCVFGQLASAVEYLHEHQVLHCDLKCSNMMIAPGRRAVLLDLGLAIRAGQENRLVGTLQYMSPEVISGHSASYASDWYSFGVMMYEVLTDRFPSVAVEPGEPGDGQSGTNYRLDLEQSRHLLQECPEDLAELCLELLRSEADQRPSGSQVVARLLGKREHRRRVSPPQQCHGRESELAALDAATCGAPSNSAGLVIVRGESGSGKSKLLRHWLRCRPHDGCLLISVRCYRQDHTPVRLLNALVQELTLAVAGLDAVCWQPLLHQHAREICQLFPQIQQLLPSASFPAMTKPALASASDSAHDVSLAPFILWLLEISHHRRLVLCVDDAQWADTESLRTLKRLIEHEQGFAGTLVLVDESNFDQLRQIFQPAEALPLQMPTSHRSPLKVTQIDLTPLTANTCHTMLGEWASEAEVPMNESISLDIIARSSGNAFLLQEIFRTYVQHVHTGDTSGAAWLLADSQSSVRRRFSLLPQNAENILQFLAVADHAMSFHQLQMVSRILPHELQRTLSLLASQGWISSRGSELESDVEIAHENFRRAILQSIPAERVYRRHYRLARILSCETPPAWARVASHYWAAQYFREASSCYLEAARQAIASNSLPEAIEFLHRADHPEAQRTPSEQRRVLRMQADCLARAGSSRAAADLYDRLLEEQLSQDSLDDEQATLLRCLSGEQRIRAGQLEEGLARLRVALHQLGMVRWPKSRFSYFCLALRTLRMGWTDPQRLLHKPAQPSTDNASAADARQPFNDMERCLNRLSPPLTFLDNQLGPDLILRMARRAELSSSDFDRALAITRSGVLISFAGRRWQRQALQRLRWGRQLARVSRSEEARATSDFGLFIWHIQRGQFRAAARFGHAALKLYRDCPVSTQWEQQFLKWAMLGVYWYGNQLGELTQRTAELRRSAHQRSDPMSLFWMHVDTAHLADLIADQPDQARQSLNIASEAIANQSFQSPRFFLWLSKIQQALYENDPQQALATLRADWKHLDQSLIMRTAYYRWLALSAKICCCLLAIRECATASHSHMRDAQKCAAAMRGLKEPIFVLCGQAFSLVLDAWQAQYLQHGHLKKQRSTIPKPVAWEATIDRLHHCGHHLLACALQWHYAHYFPSVADRSADQNPQTILRSQGCIRPDKLLNMLLPLPFSSHPNSPPN